MCELKQYRTDAVSFLMQERKAVEFVRGIVEQAEADGWIVIGDTILAPDVWNAGAQDARLSDIMNQIPEWTDE